MARGYKIEDYKEAIRTLRETSPNLKILTQIIVAFPGETEEDFNETVRLLDEIHFDFVEVYGFQPRPHTRTAEMEDQVPKKVAKRRYHQLYMRSLLDEGRRRRAPGATHQSQGRRPS